MIETAHRREAGFTLIEALIASLLLIVAVAGVMALFPQAYRDTTQASRASELNQLASERLEKLKATSFDDSDLAIGAHPAPEVDGWAYYYRVAGYPREYSLRWDVTLVDPGVKRIVVTTGYGARYNGSDALFVDKDGFVEAYQTLVTE